MAKNDDEESLPEYQLRILWTEREKRLFDIQQDKGMNLKSLIATPERMGLTILFAAQAMGFGPEVLQALAKMLGVK
jgi:hypothetical protein